VRSGVATDDWATLRRSLSPDAPVIFSAAPNWNRLHELASWVWSARGRLVHRGPLQTTADLASAEGQEAVRFMHGLVLEGRARLDPRRAEVLGDVLMRGEVGAVQIHPGVLPHWPDNWSESVRLVPFPGRRSGWGAGFTGGSGLAVGAHIDGEARRDAARSLVAYLTGPGPALRYGQTISFPPAQQSAFTAFTEPPALRPLRDAAMSGRSMPQLPSLTNELEWRATLTAVRALWLDIGDTRRSDGEVLGSLAAVDDEVNELLSRALWQRWKLWALLAVALMMLCLASSSFARRFWLWVRTRQQPRRIQRVVEPALDEQWAPGHGQIQRVVEHALSEQGALSSRLLRARRPDPIPVSALTALGGHVNAALGLDGPLPWRSRLLVRETSAAAHDMLWELALDPAAGVDRDGDKVLTSLMHRHLLARPDLSLVRSIAISGGAGSAARSLRRASRPPFRVVVVTPGGEVPDNMRIALQGTFDRHRFAHTDGDWSNRPTINVWRRRGLAFRSPRRTLLFIMARGRSQKTESGLFDPTIQGVIGADDRLWDPGPFVDWVWQAAGLEHAPALAIVDVCHAVRDDHRAAGLPRTLLQRGVGAVLAPTMTSNVQDLPSWCGNLLDALLAGQDVETAVATLRQSLAGASLALVATPDPTARLDLVTDDALLHLPEWAAPALVVGH